MSLERYEDYAVTETVVRELADRTVARGMRLAKLRTERDAWQAASKTLARLAREAGASAGEIAETLVDALDGLVIVPESDALQRAEAQLEGCRSVCLALVDLAEAHGLERPDLLESVRFTVSFHLQLRRAQGPADLGIGIDDPPLAS